MWLQGELADTAVWIRCEPDGGVFRDGDGHAHVRYHANPSARVFPAPADLVRVAERQPTLPEAPHDGFASDREATVWWNRMSQFPAGFFDKSDDEEEEEEEEEKEVSDERRLADGGGADGRSTVDGGGADGGDDGLDGPASFDDALAVLPIVAAPSPPPPLCRRPTAPVPRKGPVATGASSRQPTAPPKPSGSAAASDSKKRKPDETVLSATVADTQRSAPTRRRLDSSVSAHANVPPPTKRRDSPPTPASRTLGRIATQPSSGDGTLRYSAAALDHRSSAPFFTRHPAAAATAAAVVLPLSAPPTRAAAATTITANSRGGGGGGSGGGGGGTGAAKTWNRGARNASSAPTPALDLGAALAERMSDSGGGGGVGNAKSTETTNGNHQANAADLIRSLPYNTILAFSDGSSKGNPGPAGAGAVVCLPPPSYADYEQRDEAEQEGGGGGGGGGGGPQHDAAYRLARTRMSRLAAAVVGDQQCGTWIEGYASLGRHTANVAEIEAIRLCNDIAVQARELLDYYRRCPIHVVTDSQVAHGVTSGKWQAKKNKELVALTGGALTDSNATVHWCKGHAGIPGNERADRLADEGAARSRGNAPPSRTIRSIAAPSPSSSLSVATASQSRRRT